MKPSLLSLALVAALAATAGGAPGGEIPKPPPSPAAMALPPAKAEAAPSPVPALKDEEPKIVFAQWHALYYSGEKIGYRTTSLYRLGDGGERLDTNVFMRRNRAENQFTYYQMIRADLDAKGRPAALDCRVKSGEREWHVMGKAAGDEFVLTRTCGATETTAKVPIGEDLMFLSWTLPATMRRGAREGQVRRWTALDESLGGVLHDSCLVRVLGTRTGTTGGGATVTGTAVLWGCAAEQVAIFTDAEGRNLRSEWQSSARVAVATGLLEARKLLGADTVAGAGGVAIEGLQGNQYANARLGYGFSVPPYPYLLDVARETGLARLASAVGGGSLMVFPAAATVPLKAEAISEEDWNRLAGLLQQQWASRYEDVVVEKSGAARVAERPVRVITGTARLGCTPLHFKNFVFVGDGPAYFVSATSDVPLSGEETLALQVPQSMRFAAPEGQLAILGRGDRFESVKQGFEVRKPGPRWKVPLRHDGPATSLELVRDDLAAVAVVRVLPMRPGQPFKDFVADQADLASDNLTVGKPVIRAAQLGGRDGLEIVYEGKLLSDQPARATGVYVPLEGKIFCLMLMARKDASEEAVKELDAIRDTVKFARAAQGR